MSKKSQPADTVRLASKNTTSYRPIVTVKHIGMAALAIISIASALALPLLPEKFQFMLIAIPLVVVAGIFILRNPHFGIYLFFVYEYMRPDAFFPMLRPLKISILLESVTLLGWIIRYLVPTKSIKWSRFNTVFLIFVIGIATTVTTAMNNKMAYDVFQGMLVYFIIFLMATNIIDSQKRLKVLIWVLLLVHFYFALKGIITGGFVGGSLMGDENDLALALNVMIPFAFFFLTGSRNKAGKLISFIILISLVLGVIASMSRGGWIGLMAVGLFCILKSKRKLMSLGVTALLAIAVVSFAPPEYWTEVESISDTHESTAQTRIKYWKAALRMYMDYPITGVGAANGGIRMPEYAKGFRNINTQWGRTFHGTLPQVIGELGSLGIGCYLLMMYLALKLLYGIQRRNSRNRDNDFSIMANSIMGGIIGFIGSATFLSVAYYPQLWTLYTLTIILYYLDRSKIVKGAGSVIIPE